MVLQTLGLNEDGDEASLRATGRAAEPTQTVENIVLEGDEVRQSEAHVPDRPLDELDLFTRRLGMATGDTANAGAARAAHAAPSSGTPAADAAAPSEQRPAGRLAARRSRMPGRRSSDGAASADAALAVARAAGRDPGIAAIEAAQIEQEESTAGAVGSPDFDIPALRTAPPMQQRLWLAGCIALLVLLLAQFVNHWRDALAASPTWGHPVTGLYAALGVPLQPHWDLSAYEVRQQGAESAGGPHAAIRVRFSLANHATRAQPVPLLRLTLLDRYGRRVAERDLTPADYWPKGRSMQSFLAADERVDTEVQVRDPSADSASFELDVCLPAGRGGIHCAGDVAAAAAAGVPP
ncbi:MAG TPA: DUF3426 domain-containing protein [Steroidobacteraceae bacterium]|nr:DUF3426 domain-containing protein [Steroidobacteraceae bacterium]